MVEVFVIDLLAAALVVGPPHEVTELAQTFLYCFKRLVPCASRLVIFSAVPSELLRWENNCQAVMAC